MVEVDIFPGVGRMAGGAVTGEMVSRFNIGVTVCALGGRASKLPIFMAAITCQTGVLSCEGEEVMLGARAPL